jgi:holliday junction DNA helicase RuvA
VISYLKGTLISADTLLTAAGVGYRITPQDTLPLNEEVELYIATIMREDGWTLYANRASSDVFTYLINLSGIGPVAALTALRQLGASRIIGIIATSDVTTLSTVKGIGQRTAAKALASAPQLSDNLLALMDDLLTHEEQITLIPTTNTLTALASNAVNKNNTTTDPDVSEIADALVNLGYPHTIAIDSATQAVTTIHKNSVDNPQELDKQRLQAALAAARAA